MTKLLELLDAQSMDLAMVANSKDDAIRGLVKLLQQAGAVGDPDTFTEAVLAREKLGSTGMGQGIAIPHGKSDGMNRAAVAFARLPSGVDWGAPDDEPARIVFLIGVPEAQAGDEHLRILAMLARKLVHESFLKSLDDAPNIQSVREVLAQVGS